MLGIIEVNAENLTFHDVLALIHGEVNAIVLKGFLDATIASKVKENLLASDKRGALQHAVEFERIGYAYSEIKTELQRAEYHDKVEFNLATLRDLLKPTDYPMDRFLYLLNKIWPKGACLLEVEAKKCFFGICRIMHQDVDLKPHTDRLERNLPESCQDVLSLSAQLSANIYISIPQNGGETEFWNNEPTESEYKNMMNGRHYGIERNALCSPASVYKPNVGDLLILNSRRIHAVRPALHEPRITISCFIGYQGIDFPLVYWS